MSIAYASERGLLARSVDRQAEQTARWGFPDWFLIAQTALPALLLLPGTQPMRVFIRVLPFGLSLFGLFITQRSREHSSHPATKWLIACLLYLGLMVLHPSTNTTLAGIAQVALYLSVMAPLFWAAMMVRNMGQLRRLLLIMLVCNGVNATVGVLQVYDPDRWLPAEFSERVVNHQYGLEHLTYIGTGGRRIVRPPGLFDAPGAVSGPAVFAGLLGITFVFQPVSIRQRVFAGLLALAGVAAILLTQVRTSLLVLIAASIVYGGVLSIQRRYAKAISFFGVALLTFSLSWWQSLQLGGGSVQQRYLSLMKDGVLATYHTSHRATMLEQAWTRFLPNYPFGAGLARWGMMRVYFGDESNVHSPSIWSELQINSWILDGGIVVLSLYTIALVVTSVHQLHIARSARCESLRVWAAPVIALCVGILTLVFGFTPFTTQIGLQYWFLVGALYGVWAHEQHEHQHSTLSAGKR